MESKQKWFGYRMLMYLPGQLARMEQLISLRFRQLTQAKEFLLDPYQRRAFNEAHGFLTPTVNVAWWSAPQTFVPEFLLPVFP